MDFILILKNVIIELKNFRLSNSIFSMTRYPNIPYSFLQGHHLAILKMLSFARIILIIIMIREMENLRKICQPLLIRLEIL